MRRTVGMVAEGDEDVGLGPGVRVDLVVRAGGRSERSVLFVQLVVGTKDQRMRALRTRTVAKTETGPGVESQGMSARLHLVRGGLAVLKASKRVAGGNTAVAMVGVLAETYIGSEEQLGEEFGEEFEGLNDRSDIRVGVGSAFVLTRGEVSVQQLVSRA
jgi:hypothetical protein